MSTPVLKVPAFSLPTATVPAWLAHPVTAMGKISIRPVEVFAFIIIAILLMAAPASAHDRDGWRHDRSWRDHHRPYYGWGPPVRYVPPPVYVVPPRRPVYVPPPVYYAPPPRVIAPAPSFNVVVPLQIR